MNRQLWSESIYKTSIPAWTCPSCSVGHTFLIAESFTFNETAHSKKEHGHDAWDPDWIEYIFSAWGRCANNKCNQDFAISGTGGVERCWEEDDQQGWQDIFTPKICLPMPRIFKLPSKCPDNIATELLASFSLLWINRESCAGRIRVALELLMTHAGVPVRGKNEKTGKEYDLKLHRRVEIYTETEPEIGSHLMALKWLGNAGSHDGEVAFYDLIDAFEILENALEEIIEKRSARVAKLAKKLDEKHNPKN
jgi:hypothetical protein